MELIWTILALLLLLIALLLPLTCLIGGAYGLWSGFRYLSLWGWGCPNPEKCLVSLRKLVNKAEKYLSQYSGIGNIQQLNARRRRPAHVEWALKDELEDRLFWAKDALSDLKDDPTLRNAYRARRNGERLRNSL